MRADSTPECPFCFAIGRNTALENYYFNPFGWGHPVYDLLASRNPRVAEKKRKKL